MTPVLSLQNISLKQSTGSLVHFSLDLIPGETHALVGSESSGRLTIAQILCGSLLCESGDFIINGKKQAGISVRNNQQKGIQVVHQNNAFFNNMTIADTLLYNTNQFLNLGRNTVKKTKRILSQYNLDYSPSTLIGDLPEPDKYFIAFIRTILHTPKVLVLDETISQIAPNRISDVTRLLNDTKLTGTAILWITSRFDDISAYADKISIMRDGKILLTDTVESIDKTSLLQLCYSQFESADSNEDSLEFHKLSKYNEAILQQLPVSLLVVDKNDQIKISNRTAQEYFQLDNQPDDLLFRDIFTEFDTTIQKIYSELAKRKDCVIYDAQINSTIASITANVRLLPIFDGSTFIGTLVIIEDITEQQQLRNQVILSEKLASVGLLAAGVAHEINNPLEIIYNYLSFLKRKNHDSKESSVLNDIEEEIEQIKQIVSNLVSFSGKNEEPSQLFNLANLMENMLNLIKYDPKYNNITTTFTTDENEPLIKADQREVRQVMLNLIKNSYEAMPEGGTIKIHAEKTEKESQTYIRITYQDTGSGISMSNPNDIFLPFNSTKSQNGSNMGLGMSIIYGIIKKHNGDITVQNLPQGCEFTITLPSCNSMRLN